MAAVVQEMATKDPDGRKSSFGTHYDANTGRVIVTTTAPKQVVDRLEDLLSDDVVVQRGDGGQQSRKSDYSPFYGGASIASPSNGNICTSAFRMVYPDGVSRMITAAHCFPAGARIYSEKAGHNGVRAEIGKIVSTVPSIDVALIAATTGRYGNSIYRGGVDSSATYLIGGINHLSGPVNDLCVSGRSTGEHCDHRVADAHARACFDGRCFQDLIAYRNGTLTRAGDSGAPVYTVHEGKAMVAGMHIALINGIMFAVRIDKIATTFGFARV
ncbi:S1 family peptidase [Lentzea sp. HUAS12]|uniref:S1 family peptidase n=1 Tax=Lentzea sp. HUAS12 TaxID=2951806 RepID=UPI0020A0D57E|nr:S1 family peptidase [Lentzea sp. HUAS12]USX56313.1 S1 family peptidase [Lentzea sp. HUAS12]